MKTVLVTGGSGAIGGACARAFAQNGYLPIVQYCANREDAERLAKDTGGVALQADLTDEASANALFEQAGKIDALVHCAGVAKREMLCDMTSESWRRVIDADLTSAFFAARGAVKQMMWHGGKIVLIGSVWGQCGASCEAAYAAAKAGLIGLAKSLAKEYPNVQTNCLCPGVIDTPMNGFLSEEEKKDLAAQIPAGRFGTAEEVAQAALFLAGADYITGQVLAVNGGLYL